MADEHNSNISAQPQQPKITFTSYELCLIRDTLNERIEALRADAGRTCDGGLASELRAKARAMKAVVTRIHSYHESENLEMETWISKNENPIPRKNKKWQR